MLCGQKFEKVYFSYKNIFLKIFKILKNKWPFGPKTQKTLIFPRFFSGQNCKNFWPLPGQLATFLAIFAHFERTLKFSRFFGYPKSPIGRPVATLCPLFWPLFVPTINTLFKILLYTGHILVRTIEVTPFLPLSLC